MALPNFPDFSILQQTINNTKTQQTNNPLWQVLSQLVSMLIQLVKSLRLFLGSSNVTPGQIQNATYVTSTNQVPILPLSRELVAGAGIQLSTAVAGELEVSSTGGTGLIPMCTGEYPGEIMFIGQSVMMIPYTGS